MDEMNEYKNEILKKYIDINKFIGTIKWCLNERYNIKMNKNEIKIFKVKNIKKNIKE